MQSGAQFPLTLTLSPGEREMLSPAWEYSLNSEHFPALPRLLPLPEGEGWGEGEGRVLLNSHHNSTAVHPVSPRSSASLRFTPFVKHPDKHGSNQQTPSPQLNYDT